MLSQDLRHAFRILGASPGFTLVAIASLALGIGANTAIFSLLNNVLLTTLPVRDPQALVLLTNPQSSGVGVGSQTGERSLLTYREFVDLQAQSRTLTSLMAASSSLHRVPARIEGAAPEEIAVTPGLGVVLRHARRAGGDRPDVHRRARAGRGALPEAVISHEFWQRRFGGRADAIGRPIALRERRVPGRSAWRRRRSSARRWGSGPTRGCRW